MLRQPPFKVICVPNVVTTCRQGLKNVNIIGHKKSPIISDRASKLAPGEGLEPPTGWLTATCSTN